MRVLTTFNKRMFIDAHIMLLLIYITAMTAGDLRIDSEPKSSRRSVLIKKIIIINSPIGFLATACHLWC